MLRLKEILFCALKYFSLVFNAGFICGSIRVPFVQPRIGDRYAQLLEMPIMLFVIWKSSHFIVSNLSTPNRNNRERQCAPSFLARFTVGMIALVLMLAVELLGQVWMTGWKGLAAFVFERDPVSGPVYFLSLAALAIFPACIS
jgi:hypothetical protein